MKSVRAFLVPVVAAALAFGCGGLGHPTRPTTSIIGSGRLVSEVRPVGEFSAIALTGAGHLIIEQTGYESLQVTAEDNILPHVRTEVRGGRLELGIEPHTAISTTTGVLYRLTVREISDIEVAGASRLDAHDLDAEDLRLVLSGASMANLGGVARQQRIEVSGASRLIADGLQSQQVVAAVSGASFARLRVASWLSASASGVSTIEYLGDPELSLSVSGSSVIRRVGW